MPTKSFIAAALLASALSAGTTAASAQQATVWVRTAPPAPRVEVVPAPRRGYQWVPGSWAWQGRRHVWQQGTWVRARPGYAYAPREWVERDGRWMQRPGQWRRADRDGDGVRNRDDRRPNDPTRR